mgnify:CR=1 FL=1
MYIVQKTERPKRMKQKYIINDIVTYDNKIMVVKEPRDGIHFDLYCPKVGLTYCYVDVENIKPVDLTSAILEKNGWNKGQVNCPNKECDNKSCHSEARNIIGWCDTPYGYMMVCECKKCFTKYRFHGTIDGKFDFDNFADNFMMRIEIEKEEL